MMQQVDNHLKPEKAKDEKGTTTTVLEPCSHIHCNGNYGNLTGPMIDVVNEIQKQSPISIDSITEEDGFDQDSGVDNNETTPSDPGDTYTPEIHAQTPEPSGHNELAAFRLAMSTNQTSNFIESGNLFTSEQRVADMSSVNENEDTNNDVTYLTSDTPDLNVSPSSSVHDKPYDVSQQSSHNTSETFDSEETYLLDDYSLSGKTPAYRKDSKIMFFYGQPIQLTKGPTKSTYEHRGWHEPLINDFYPTNDKTIAASQKKMFKRVRKLVG